MNVAPLSRTPMDEKSSRALKKYSKDIEKSFEQMVPWQRETRRLANLRGKVKPGEVVVMLEAGESSKNPIFKDAKVTRER